MKKKLLFVIPSLDAGGAEKSLVNLLNTLDFSKVEVDLFLFKHNGLFLNLVPKEVSILPLNKEYQLFSKNLGASIIALFLSFKIVLLINRILFAINNKIYKNNAIAEQQGWKYLKKSFTKLPKKYDTAIGFLEKSSIYFSIDLVNATNKIGFIHNDYNKLGLNKKFDQNYFQKLHKIVTVSQECAVILQQEFSNQASKVVVMHNIVSGKLIHKMAQEPIDFKENNTIISVGRLHPQKGFDLAIESAKILRDKEINFCWYVIGEGQERQKLEQLIANYELQNHFKFLGLKQNPYPYIRQATVYAQTSRYEGKSIAIDEAMILHKPIVVTNFSTAKDQIIDNYNGLIAEMNPESIAVAICKLLLDKELAEKLIFNLKNENLETTLEINKLYAIL
jgi:glycosyltransferase involved in cell wall biosynthesis